MATPIGSMYASLTLDASGMVAGGALADRVITRTARNIRRETGLAQASMQRFSGSLNTGIRPYGLIAVSRAFERTNDRVSLLRGSMLALTGVFGGFTAAIGSNLVLRYADTFTNLSNQIRVVSKDSQELAGRIAAVSEAANRSRSSLQSTATLYARLQKAAPTRTSSEILEYTQTIQKALALGGATTQEATSAAIQFSQAIASNRFGGEELRAILETPLGLELAKGLGVTIGKFREMGHAGELTAQVVLGALAKIKGNIDEQFSKSVRTIDQSLVQADNALTAYVGSLDQAYGLTSLVSGSILGFANNIGTVANVAGVAAVALAAAFGGKFIGGNVGKAIGATFGEVERRAAAAKIEVETLTKAQDEFKQQIDRTTNAISNLNKKGNIEFASKSDTKAVAREEARLKKLQDDRIANTKKLGEINAQIGAGQVNTNKRIEASAEKIVATESKMEAGRRRLIELGRAQTQVETRLTAIAGQQATNAAKLSAQREADRDLVRVRREMATETEKVAKLETNLGEQRVRLAGQVGAAEAKAAEQRARLSRAARTAGQEDLRLRSQIFAQQQRLSRVTAGISEIGSLNKAGQIRDMRGALDGLNTNLSTTSMRLVAAAKGSSLLNQSWALLGRGGRSLAAFLGGPWGVAFTVGIAAMALLGRQSAATAALIERTEKSMRDRLGKIAEKGGEIGRAAEESLAVADIRGQRDAVVQEIEGYKSSLEIIATEVDGLLQDIFGSRMEARTFGGQSFDTVFNGVKADLDAIAEKVARGTLGMDKIGDAIRAVPNLDRFAGDDKLVKNLSDAVQRAADLKRNLKDAGREGGELNATLEAGVGAMEAMDRRARALKVFAAAESESMRNLRENSKIYDDLIKGANALARETEMEARIREGTVATLKEQKGISEQQAADYAKIRIVVDAVKNGTDDWWKSSEALNGEFGAILLEVSKIPGVMETLVSLSYDVKEAISQARIAAEAPGWLKNAIFETEQLKAAQDALARGQKFIADENHAVGSTAFDTDVDKRAMEIMTAAQDFAKEAGKAVTVTYEMAQAQAQFEVAMEGSTDGLVNLTGATGDFDQALTTSISKQAQWLQQQSATILESLAFRQALSDTEKKLEGYNHGLQSILNRDLTKLFGSPAAAERAQEQYGLISQEILKLAEDMLTTEMSGKDLIDSMAGIEERLRALGANDDALEGFINSVLRLIGHLAGASAQLDELNAKMNQTKVGATGVQTRFPNGQSVTRHTGVNTSSGDSRLDPLGNFATFASGGFTGNAPADAIAGFVHGQEYVFDAKTTRRIGAGNLDAIRKGVRGYQSGGAVRTSVGALAGGRDTLRMIEENTFQALGHLTSVIGYLDTMVKDGQTNLTVLRAIEKAMGALSGRTGTTGSSGSGSSSGGGGFSSGGGTGFSSNDANSPYYYNGRMALPGGAQYDPVADFMYNGNQGALGQIAGSGYSMYEATGFNTPGAIGSHVRGGFQSNLDLANALRAQGSSVGAYGGGITLSAGDSSSFLNDRTLASFFGSGSRMSAGLGFAKGGYIHPGDSQKVSFFKNKNEAVGIFTPAQMDAMRNANDNRGQGINAELHYHAAPGNPDPSPQSMMEQEYRFRSLVQSMQEGRR